VITVSTKDPLPTEVSVTVHSVASGLGEKDTVPVVDDAALAAVITSLSGEGDGGRGGPTLSILHC